MVNVRWWWWCWWFSVKCFWNEFIIICTPSRQRDLYQPVLPSRALAFPKRLFDRFGTRQQRQLLQSIWALASLLNTSLWTTMTLNLLFYYYCCGFPMSIRRGEERERERGRWKCNWFSRPTFLQHIYSYTMYKMLNNLIRSITLTGPFN